MQVPREPSVKPANPGQPGPALGSQPYGQPRQRRRIILCFDGTGNKFQGTDADSNILKIYRMLDRDNGDKHYYQPGIGTYVNSRSLSHTSTLARLNSWYQKAKDSAVGSSFDAHVMGAYKFLMSCYDDDDIYFFGFSRGSYVARFLAEMLDHVGLLSQGNEEMARFAWKAFAQWQERDESTEEEKEKKKKMLHFLEAFRDTFSRPVRRIRFLGLFDTVNSVPRFENAWMQRSKFPYTARSRAKVIRHAVSIDERRAKFRSDLISEAKTSRPSEHHRLHHRGRKGRAKEKSSKQLNGSATSPNNVDRFRRRSQMRSVGQNNRENSPQAGAAPEQDHLDPRASTAGRFRSPSPAVSRSGASEMDRSSIHSTASSILPPHIPIDDDDEDEAAPQDIEELWFPGCHADLGGGWPLADGEESPLSHGPLVWMVREAQRAGLNFDSEKMLQLRCCDDNYSNYLPSTADPTHPAPPEIQVTSSPSTPNIFNSPRTEKENPGWAPGLAPDPPKKSVFHQNLETAATKGVLHDCLEFNNGLSASSVLSWKFMEYMPFRRMDLRPDGSWKAISLPLPMGETRDIPENAKIHHSAIRRMEADEKYRPGNLIIGGGGRGVRKAPKHLGIGQWDVLKGEGDPVGMVYVRKGESLDHKIDREGGEKN